MKSWNLCWFWKCWRMRWWSMLLFLKFRLSGLKGWRSVGNGCLNWCSVLVSGKNWWVMVMCVGLKFLFICCNWIWCCLMLWKFFVSRWVVICVFGFLFWWCLLCRVSFSIIVLNLVLVSWNWFVGKVFLIMVSRLCFMCCLVCWNLIFLVILKLLLMLFFWLLLWLVVVFFFCVLVCVLCVVFMNWLRCVWRMKVMICCCWCRGRVVRMICCSVFVILVMLFWLVVRVFGKVLMFGVKCCCWLLLIKFFLCCLMIWCCWCVLSRCGCRVVMFLWNISCCVLWLMLSRE